MRDELSRQPPANLEAEQALLGAIMIENAVLDRIAGILEASDFSESIHAHVYAAAVRMRQSGELVSPLTLRAHVDGLEAGDLPVWKYLGKVAAQTPSIANAVAYAETVKDQAARRRLFELGEDLMAVSRNPAIATSDMASQAVTALDHVLAISSSKKRQAVPLGSAMADVLDQVMNDDGSTRITSGLHDLDKVLCGGWRRKQYAILAGRPSMGKTTVATSAMLRTAKAGHGVLMLSLEMPTEQVAARAMTDLAYTSLRRTQYNAFLSGQCNEQELKLIADAGSQFRKLPLVIDDERGLTIAEIGARIRAQAQKFEKAGIRLGLVVIDHLGFIKASERYRGNRVHEVTEISAGLGQIAKELDIALVVLCQLNRGTESRENKRPTLADLRDSGSLEQDADVVIFTFRESYYLERMRCDAGSQAELQRQTDLEACRNTLELLISKNRNGPTTTVTLYCDMGSNAVRDLG
jgi:replicative DNA helicase